MTLPRSPNGWATLRQGSLWRLCALGLWLAAGPAAAAPEPAWHARVRQVLPSAERFEVQTIPPARRSPEDAEQNTTFMRAFDRQDLLVGYVRDYAGPVSPAAACPCSPLQLTLAFSPDRRLLGILSPTPLQKWGHEALSPQEHDLLLRLAQAPPPALTALAEVEEVIDLSTGATRHALADAVVPRAALTTRRIVGLVQDTQRLLTAAPVDPERAQLQSVLTQPLSTLGRARALAKLQGRVHDPALQRQVYQAMVHFYLQFLASDIRGDRGVERQLLRPSLDAEVLGPTLAAACSRLADRNLRPPVVDACIRHLRQRHAPTVPSAQLALLIGTDHVNKNRLPAALKPLQEASQGQRVEANAALFTRLARALDASGQRRAACRQARSLFQAHPLLPEARALLGTCVESGTDIDSIRSGLELEMRTRMLASDRGRRTSVVPSISLQTPQGSRLEVPVAVPGQITLVLFFATWCPHCRVELPRLRDFVAALPRQPFADRVRLLVVRTAIERESQPYADFLAQLQPNFPIYNDGADAAGLNLFVRSVGMAAALPTTALVDGEGFLRYVVPAGDFRDTAQELSWLLGGLVPPN